MANLTTLAALKAYFQTNDKPTQAQFAELIDALKGWPDDAIVTTEGKRYDLTGLTDTQKGDALRLAHDELTNNSGNIILFPGGSYYMTESFIWKKNRCGMFGVGRSKMCEITSDSTTFDTFILDAQYTLYNTVLGGFSIANTAEYDEVDGRDALRIANLGGGAAIDVSQVEMNVHIHQASRDGFHVDSGLNIDGNFDIKMTSTLGTTGIGRHSFYCNSGGNGLKLKLRTTDASIYLDSSSENVSIEYPNSVNVSEFRKLTWVNLGTNNYFSSPSLFDPIDRTTGTMYRIKIDNGVLGIEDALA